MRLSLSIAALCTYGFLACLPSIAQEAKTENGSTPPASVNQEQKATNGPSKQDTQQFVIRVKTKQKVDFSGTVTHVDPGTAILSIHNQGKTITFDMSKAILIGYQNTGEIRKGDSISVGYTQYGLQIRKGIFAVTYRVTVPQKNVTGGGTVKTQKSALARWKDNRNSKGFYDVDNNKDGKITPIELCALVPDLTLQKFREYDKNGDGCLSKVEFNSVKIVR